MRINFNMNNLKCIKTNKDTLHIYNINAKKIISEIM